MSDVPLSASGPDTGIHAGPDSASTCRPGSRLNAKTGAGSAPGPGQGASLDDWLLWLENLHPAEIELGLERVREVAVRAGLTEPGTPLITVAGTNGKGSTVAMLDAIYRQAGWRTGVYTSPHVRRFSERISIAGIDASDASIVQALESIEAHRQDTSLTYFEYTTLAAMRVFMASACDIVILEVGLGGRLDATNLWSADCAIVTSVALDHEAWLGNTRAAIGCEKVAIGRPGRPVVIGDDHPPEAMLALAHERGMQVQLVQPLAVTPAALPGEHQRRNAACAMAAVAALNPRLPVDPEQALLALMSARVAGRLEHQQVEGIEVLLDVAHNPAAAQALAATLVAGWPGREIHVVFSALVDKDIVGVVEALEPTASAWYCAALSVARAAPLNVLLGAVRHTATASVVSGHESIARAAAAAVGECHAARQAGRQPLLLVVGSFHTLQAWQQAHPMQVMPT